MIVDVGKSKNLQDKPAGYRPSSSSPKAVYWENSPFFRGCESSSIKAFNWLEYATHYGG